MALANMATSGKNINAKESIIHKLLSIVDHGKITLHAL